MKHNWQYAFTCRHNHEYWYKCSNCGKMDWIASYGTVEQLNHTSCLSDESTKENMNENIKEIANRVGLYIDSSGRWANTDSVVQFASEIVRECSKFTNFEALSKHGIDPGKRMRRHFGVDDE